VHTWIFGQEGMQKTQNKGRDGQRLLLQRGLLQRRDI